MIENTGNLCVEKLNKTHLDKLLKLQAIVQQEINDPAYCLQLTVDEFHEVLVDKTGLTVGIFDAENLIGYHAALFPGIRREDNLGYQLGFRNAVIDEVFHLEICNIHPHYRGKSLQARMAHWLIQKIKLTNQYRYLCETVAPNNIGSIKNTLAIHAYIIELKAMYGGHERYIFFQDIQTPIVIEDSSKIDILLDDKESQKQLFSQGYVGIKLKFEGKEGKLMMGKPIENRIPI